MSVCIYVEDGLGDVPDEYYRLDWWVKCYAGLKCNDSMIQLSYLNCHSRKIPTKLNFPTYLCLLLCTCQTRIICIRNWKFTIQNKIDNFFTCLFPIISQYSIFHFENGVWLGMKKKTIFRLSTCFAQNPFLHNQNN